MLFGVDVVKGGGGKEREREREREREIIVPNAVYMATEAGLPSNRTRKARVDGR